VLVCNYYVFSDEQYAKSHYQITTVVVKGSHRR